MTTNNTFEMEMKDGSTKHIKVEVDKFMINQCNETTHKMLKAGVGIDTVCKVIKDYQQKYLCLKDSGEFSAEQVKVFTFEFYWKQGDFGLKND